MIGENHINYKIQMNIDSKRIVNFHNSEKNWILLFAKHFINWRHQWKIKQCEIYYYTKEYNNQRIQNLWKKNLKKKKTTTFKVHMHY